MSITGKLRRYASAHDSATLFDIADRIDAEHERDITMARGEAVAELGSKVAREYVKLPVDADGVPIHMGDRLVEPEYVPNGGTVVGIKLYSGWDHWLVNCGAWVDPRNCRHHEPTVEDVLREFGKCWDDPAHYAKGELVEAFAAKLQLRED